MIFSDVRYRRTIPTGEWERVRKHVLPFASGDPARPMLTGVLLEVHEGIRYWWATDSYQLVRLVGPSDPGPDGVWWVPPDLFRPARPAPSRVKVDLRLSRAHAISNEWARHADVPLWLKRHLDGTPASPPDCRGLWDRNDRSAGSTSYEVNRENLTDQLQPILETARSNKHRANRIVYVRTWLDGLTFASHNGDRSSAATLACTPLLRPGQVWQALAAEFTSRLLRHAPRTDMLTVQIPPGIAPLRILAVPDWGALWMPARAGPPDRDHPELTIHERTAAEMPA